jgi:hypothetical protein
MRKRGYWTNAAAAGQRKASRELTAPRPHDHGVPAATVEDLIFMAYQDTTIAAGLRPPGRPDTRVHRHPVPRPASARICSGSRTGQSGVIPIRDLLEPSVRRVVRILHRGAVLAAPTESVKERVFAGASGILQAHAVKHGD